MLGNFFGQIGAGSFAYVGENLIDTAPAPHDRLYLSLEIGEKCPLTCKHCIYHRATTRSSLSPNELTTVLNHGLSNGLRPLWISFSGKEPTAFRAELVDLAYSLKDCTSHKILMTNGLMLREGLCRELYQLIDCLDISIDGDKETHEWMRGPHTFDHTWQNLCGVVERGDFARVGIIATATSGTWFGIPRLAQRLSNQFGEDGSKIVSLSVSLYFGHPDDPLQFDKQHLKGLIQELSNISFPSRILLTCNYAHLYDFLVDTLDIALDNAHYDVETALPVIKFGSTDLLLFNLCAAPTINLRLSSDGLVYLSCTHLSLPGGTDHLAVGDLYVESLESIYRRVLNRKSPMLEELEQIPNFCVNQPCYTLCQGGDRLYGYYLYGRALDPFCKRIPTTLRVLETASNVIL